MATYNPEPMTTCARCGKAASLIDETQYAGSELPTWEGATLCNECYAAELGDKTPDVTYERFLLVSDALTGIKDAFAQSAPDDWPGLVTELLRILVPLGLNLDAVKQAIDDQLPEAQP